MKTYSYDDAGVNIDAGNEAVQRIKKVVKETFNPCVLSDIGLFGGLFELNSHEYQHPVLVSSTDGVGTKTKIAHEMKKYFSLGQDIVGHSINDILVQGAKPLFFLDYIGSSHIQPQIVEEIVLGMVKTCKSVNLALIGGETAEMPSIYVEGDYDIVGTIIGVVDKSKIIRGEKVIPSDICIGLPSVSLHTNGYSLARKLVKEVAGLEYTDYVEEIKGIIGENLLIPHKHYFNEIFPILNQVEVKAMAHITGGGILENPPRVLPDNCRIRLRKNSWVVPPIFSWLVKLGKLSEYEAYRTLNMGIGMLLIVSKDSFLQAVELLKQNQAEPYVIGEVIQGEKGVELIN